MLVLVTRPEHDARRTAERLVALGHEPLVAPVLRIEPTGEPPPAGPFDAIVVTSANAVPALAVLGPRTSAPVFAVGDRTAALAAAAGFVTRSASGDARALAALVQAALPCGASLLHVAGVDRKREPGASLAEAGYRVVPWAVYAATALDRLPADLEAALRQRTGEAALHYSRRSAETLLRLALAADLTAPLLDVTHLCLSCDAAAPLQQAGAPSVVVAPRPDEEALLAMLATLPIAAPERSPAPARKC